MKAVMLSIQPKWCELIANGKKTVEVRKTKPKIKTPFKVYIYCTLQGSNEFFKDTLGGDISKWNKGKWGNKKGKVIGEFVCNRITEIFKRVDEDDGLPYFETGYVGSPDCLTFEELEAYLSKGIGYAWHISDLAIYDKPKELSEFFVYCDRCDKRPIACEFAYEESNENGYYSECKCDFKRPIKRPPQSWCYVEELK